MTEQETTPEIKMDPDDLYHEEMFTDRKMGTIRKLTPVDRNGEKDTDRKILYIGQAQMMTPVGAIPLTFEIEADSFEQAIENFGDAAKVAVDRAVDEIKELQRQAASSIVLPGSAGGGGGLGGGGTPGGGGIQIP